MDKLSPESLEVVGRVVLRMVDELGRQVQADSKTQNSD